MVYQELGLPDDCLTLATGAITYFEQSGYSDLLWDIRPIFGWMLGSVGAVDQGLAYNERARTNFPQLKVVTNAVHARLLLHRGELKAAQAAMGDAPLASFRGYLRLSTTPPGALLVILTHAELALAANDSSRTLEITNELIPLLKGTGFPFFALEAMLLNARALTAQGHTSAAHAVLREARTRANGMHARWIQWQILSELAQVETVLGNTDAAETASSDARTLIESVAAHSAKEYRTSFLQLASVKNLLDNTKANA